MQVERIEEMRLTKADEAEIGDLLGAAFSADFGGRSYFQQRQHVRLVVRDGTQIIGHMGLCYRAVRLGGALIDIVGLGDVATRPEARGKGVATTLMTAAIDEAKQTRARFFVLFGNRPIYAGHGFQNVAGPIRYVDLEDVRTGEVKEHAHPDLMILPLHGDEWPLGETLDLVGHSF